MNGGLGFFMAAPGMAVIAANAARLKKEQEERMRRNPTIQMPSDLPQRYEDFVKANTEYEEALNSFELSLSEGQNKSYLDLKVKAQKAHLAYTRLEYKLNENHEEL